MAAELIEINDLYCERDDRILFEDLSFTLEKGQILQLVGRNGSGKTSLLRILCGLYHAYEGSVKFLNQEISKDRESFHNSLVYIGHHVSVKAGLTAQENLRWYAKIHPQLDPLKIESALASVGLAGYEDVICQNLSAGQKRRVNLARLFMLPREQFANSIWILDEPFTAIDVQGVTELEAKILEYSRAGGAVILTTHQALQISENVSQLNLDDWGT